MNPDHANAIPAELKRLDRWVLWKREERGGRPTKVPYSLSGQKAKSDNPATWSTFETTLDHLQVHRTTFDGIGFVLSAEDDIIGVDLDHCIDPTGTVMPWARRIVSTLDSYTEFSPSGSGLHILVRGKKPDARCKQGNIHDGPNGCAFEWYDSLRYFTVSGRHLPGSAREIVRRNGELKKVRDWIWPVACAPVVKTDLPGDDDSLLEKIRASAKAVAFERLWTGDWQAAGYGSQSEADLALCATLAFWTGRDVARMDRLFRESALFRSEKWDRHAGHGRTYGQRTIETACSGCSEAYGERRPSRRHQVPSLAKPEDEQRNAEQVRELFPRRPFPWHVFPAPIADSLKQLARSCAGSPNPLPGTVFCLIGAALGRTVGVLPKESWKEPLIFWHLDIEESGSGKTSPMWMLAEVMKQNQALAHERYAREYAEWRSLAKDDKSAPPEPNPARGYFLTDATLEGLRHELEAHPTGGLAMILNEASFLINSHNQYKARGTDREAWLCLWDGQPVRVVRVGKSVFLKGARVQVCGGIQPEVFKAAFSAKNGLYMCDGTAFRCLVTFEPPTHYEQTEEAWSENSRAAWEKTLAAAVAWADDRATQDDPLEIQLSPEARTTFLDWRNRLDAGRDELPAHLRGFLPKAFSYALRLAGALHCLKAFHAGKAPGQIMDRAGILEGIDVAEFYLGQAVDAVRLLAEEASSRPREVSDRTQLLARVLDSLRGDIDNGRLAVGFIQERYNALAPNEGIIKSPHAMGAMLRSTGLAVSAAKLNANGRRATRCLLWDSKIEDFVQTSQTSKPQSLRLASQATPCFADLADKADLFSDENRCPEPPRH